VDRSTGHNQLNFIAAHQPGFHAMAPFEDSLQISQELGSYEITALLEKVERVRFGRIRRESTS
jgi:hypothetical protein